MMRRKTSPEVWEVDAILTSDWHLREDQPICRTDNFWNAQWAKVDEVHALQKRYNCPVIHAGDLYHHWKPSPYLLSTTKIHIPNKFYTVYGQHDLPQHNWELRIKCGIYDLWVSQTIGVLEGGSWNQEPGTLGTPGFKEIGILHRFVWDGKKIPWPGCDEQTALDVLREYPQFKLIVTGDHHKPFTKEYKGRLLVNCGCLTRQAADYANHKPRVWLYNAKSNTVRPHFLKCSETVVSRLHLEIQEARDERIAAFISRLDDSWDVAISFEENLDRFIRKNKVRKEVVEIIYKSIEV